MYEVSVKKSFSAAHKLKIGGKCENLHGHNFIVEVTVSTAKLDSEGIVIDFRLLKQWTTNVIDEMDHTYLNDLPLFKDISPTSENVARIIYEKIAGMIDKPGVTLSQVSIWESESSRVSYRGNE
jgi:6-pyruvoyltetrahydropterin/6-carboxytetrahydropterin synthase